MHPEIYFVPVVDVSWAGLGPLNPRKNYAAPPPPLELCQQEADQLVDFMGELYGGRYAICVYTGTYCRDAFSREPFLTIWRRAVAAGAQILVHTHEEIAGVGTRNGDKEHMTRVIREQYQALRSAGLNPVGYRGGLYGYANFLTPLLEELNLTIDFSAAPGMNKPDREAVWTGIPYTAFYLCPENKLHVNCEHTPSRVLEIPIGADGRGTENQNYLYIDYDLSTLETLTGIWDKIRERARQSGIPQFIHTLFHTFSMSNPDMVERYRRFTGYMLERGGEPVTPTLARDTFNRIMNL